MYNNISIYIYEIMVIACSGCCSSCCWELARELGQGPSWRGDPDRRVRLRPTANLRVAYL